MRLLLSFGLAVLLIPLVAFAGTIQLVDPNSLTTNTSEDFEAIPEGNYDNFPQISGITFAERFFGQMISFDGDFDVVTGLPDNPLSSQPGEPNKTLAIVLSGNNVLAGLGPVGFPDNDAIGEGAISIEFAIDHSEIGMDIIGTSGGGALFEFFRRDGSLIDSLAIPTSLDGPRAFRQSGGSAEIAGVVMTNTDVAGIGIDNIQFNTNCIVFRGLEHCALGSAILTLKSNQLSVTNIGSSGQDGVVVYLPEVQSWYSEMPASILSQPATADASVETAVIGSISGSPDQVILRHREVAVDSKWEFLADFHDPSLVRTGVASCGGSVVAVDRSDDPDVDPDFAYRIDPGSAPNPLKGAEMATGWWRLVLDGRFSYWECGGT